MGFLSRWRMAADVASEAAPAFGTIGTDDVDPSLFGLASYGGPMVSTAARVSRQQAMQVPSVKRARDVLCGSMGSLPLEVRDADNRVVGSAFLSQPEAAVPRSVTWTRVYEDLVFESVAWLRVVGFDWRGFPASVVRLDPRSVDVQQDQRVFVRRDGSVQGSTLEWIPDGELIRIDSPNDPLLVAGARAIRTCLQLEATAALYAEVPLPLGYFSAEDGAYHSEEQVQTFLKRYEESRRSHSVGFIGGGLTYNPVGYSPEQMQLAAARQHCALEIARLFGLDPEDLGVSTTSRTYQNSQDRRMSMINDVLGPYVSAVEDRLSMPDVTPRGYRVKADYSGFLRADDATRLGTYQQGLDMGLYDLADIARREGLPPPPDPTDQQEVPVPQDVPATASTDQAAVTFDDPPQVIPMAAEQSPAVFEVDLEARTITGLCVPYNQVAMSGGRRWSFSAGSITYGGVSRVELLVQHDFSQAVGKAVKIWETDAGLMCTFKVARGDAGDRALLLAEDGVLDGLSVGLAVGGKYDTRDGINHATRAPLAEVSLTPAPAFDDARITSVTATADSPTVTLERSTPVPDTITTEVAPESSGPDFSAITQAITTGFTALGTTPAREVIPAGAAMFISEPLPYTMDGRRGEHCFSSDLIAHLQRGDGEAGARVDRFMEAAFNVTVSNVGTLNPAQTRSDLYVDQLSYQYPMFTAINKGVLSDPTPFVVPKYSSSSGLVADHTEGTEPTGGGFTTTSQTITPTPLSGKVIINREVWDQGGSPQLDTILWRQIEKAYYEGLESFVQAQLVANAASITDITITTAAADAALEASLTSQLAALQYVRGGLSMRDFFLQVDLFKALVAAKDTAGRRLFPMINPQNANGTTETFWGSVMVGGLKGVPAWATAATGSVAASSWLLNRENVHAWASVPRKITMDSTAVATVSVGVWGYKAFAITDYNGIREVVYDPV